MSEENGNGGSTGEAPEDRDELLEAIERVREAPDDPAAWQRVEDIASEQQRPDEVAALYAEVFAQDLSPALAAMLGERGERFIEEWFGEGSPELLGLLTRRVALDPSAEETFQRLTIAHTVAGRWDELFDVYDVAIAGAQSDERRAVLLREAANASRDFAQYPDRAIGYLEQLVALKPDDAELSESLERLLERQERWPDLIEFWSRGLQSCTPDEALGIRARIAECYLERLNRADAALEQAKLLLEEEGGGDAAVALLERIAGLEDAEIRVRQSALEALKGHYGEQDRVDDVVRTLEAAIELADESQAVALHREAGATLMGLGRDEDAARHFAAVLRMEPTAAVALIRLRELAKRTGDQESFARTLEAAAEDCDAVSTRVALWLEAAKTRSVALGDGDGAVAIYRRVLEEPDADVSAALEACRRVGELYEAAGQREEQLIVLERLASLEPEPAVRNAVIGRAARLADELGQTERALDLWRGRVEADAADVEALDAIIEILARESAWEPLIEMLRRRAAAPVPRLQKRADLIEIAVIQEQQLEQAEEAIETWQQVAETFGEDAEVVDALARLLSRSARWDELVALLTRATERESAHVADLLVWLADAYRGDLDDPRRALELYLRAQRVAPEHEGLLAGLSALLENEECRAEAARTLAEAYEGAGRWIDALGLLDARLEGAATDVERVHLLREAARTQERLANEPEAALGSLARAFVLAPDDEVLGAEVRRLAEVTGAWALYVESVHRAAEATESEARRAALLFEEGEVAEAHLEDAEIALEAFTRVLEKTPEDIAASGGVVRAAGRLGMWDRLARSVVVTSIAVGEIPEELVKAMERAADEAGAWDQLTQSLEEALEAAGEISPTLGRSFDKTLARWHRTRRDDDDAAAAAYRRAASREGVDLEVLQALAAHQRKSPGPELFGTLLRISDLVLLEDDLDPLDEAAKLAVESLDEETALSVLTRLFHEASRLWRSQTPARGAVSAEEATRWTMDELVRRHEAAERWDEAVALLGRGAELPLEPELWRAMRRRAAALLAGPIGDRGRAIVLLRGLVDENPDDAETLAELGNVVAAEGRLPELLALRQHELSLGVEPERALELRLDIARIVGELEATGGRIEALQTNLDQQPGHPETVAALIEVLENARRQDDLAAILEEQAERLIEMNQGERAAELMAKVAALAEESLGDSERAIRAWGRVADLTGAVEAFDALARLHEEREQFGAAARWLARRLAATEGDERVHVAMRLARARLTAGQRDRAIAVLQAANQERPDVAELRELLASLYREGGDDEALAELLTGAAPHVVEQAELLSIAREAASIYGRLGSPDRAIEVLQRAAEAVPDDQEIRRLLADGLLAAGRLDEAEELYLALIEPYGRRRNASRAALHYQLARVKKGQGDLDGALDQLEQASSMDVGNTRIMGMLASLSREAGQQERAERTYRALLMIVRRQPPKGDDAVGEAEVLYELHLLAKERGQADQAEDLLRQALKSVAASSGETARFRRAMLERGDYTLLLEALELRAETVGDGPELTQLLEAQAQVLDQHLDRTADAVERRLRAIDLEVDAWPVHDALRDAARRIGASARYVEALRERIEKARRASDAELASELLARLGAVLEEDLEDYAGAIETYRKMEEWGVRSSEARVAQARVSIARGDDVGAIEILERIVGDEDAAAEDRLDARYRLAEFQLASDEHVEEGVSTLEAALKEDRATERAGAILRAVTDARSDVVPVMVLYERVARAADDSELLLDCLTKRSRSDDVSLHELREAVSLAEELEEAEVAESLLRRAVELAQMTEEGLAAAPWAVMGLARRRRAAGDIGEALTWMRAAAEVAVDPQRRAELWAETAELATAEGDFATAVEVYQLLLEPDPSDAALWRRLLDVLCLIGDEDELVVQVNAALDALTEPADQNEVRLVFAKYLLEQSGREPDAADVLRSILEVDRSHKVAYGMLVELFERTGYDEELAELLTRQLEAAYEDDDKESVHDLALRLGRNLERVRREDAMNVYRRALQTLPDDREIAEALLALFGPDDDPRERVELLERPLRTEEGEAAAELALRLADEWEALDDDQSVHRVLSLGYETCPENEEVLQRLERWYHEHEQWSRLADLLSTEAARRDDAERSVPLLRNAAALRHDVLQDPSGAAAALAAARAYAPGDVELLEELVAFRVEAGEHATAVEEVAAALEAVVEDERTRAHLLRLRARLLGDSGQTAAAVEDLEAAYHILGDVAEEELVAALDRHRVALAEAGDGEGERAATLRLVEILRSRGDQDRSRELLMAWLDRVPDDREALYRLRDVEEAAEQWQAVASICARLVEIEEGDAQVDAALRLADAWEREGAPDAALLGLEHVFNAQPHASVLRDRLWALYEQIGATERLASLLVADAIKLEDEEERFALLRKAGDLYLQSEDGAAMAIEPLEEALRLKPDDHDTTVLLVDACIAGGQTEKAHGLLESAIAAMGNRRGPKPAALQARMAKLAEAAGDRQSQLYWLNVSLDSNKRDGYVAAELAELAMELGDYDVALKALRVVTVSRRESPMSLATAFLYQAKIAHYRGESRQAQMWARRALSEDKDFAEAEAFLAEIGGS